MRFSRIIKNLFITLIYLFTINIFLSKLNYNIPISIFSLLIVYFFKFPGLILLLFLSRW
ncbi:MAG: pro-sigmaK processing inhibitor BofA family protein [Bacilli bacterium]|nr:pro-sigmaK processing inhibitor BofA family protein [Bacilli bacterium]